MRSLVHVSAFLILLLSRCITTTYFTSVMS